MSVLLQFASEWGHALAAVLFTALAIWISRQRDASLAKHLLVAGLVVTAFWSLLIALHGAARPVVSAAETIRNLLWLCFMFVLLDRGEGRRGGQPMAVTAIYAVLALLLVCQAAVDTLSSNATSAAAHEAAVYASLILRMMAAVGALVLVHDLYTASAPEARARIRLPMAALTAMWTYDLTIYTIAYLSHGNATEFFALRGVVMALLAPVFALGAHRNDQWRLRLSRTAAFHSLSLGVIGLYVTTLVLVAIATQAFAGPYARLVQISFVFGLSVVALILLPSESFRAWLRVKIAKHFFAHRYDYRAEWIGFIDTVGRADEDAAPLNQRVVKAVADITDSPAGLLLLRDTAGGLAVDSHWNWDDLLLPAHGMTAADSGELEKTGWIVDLDGLRAGRDSRPAPDWMVAERSAWAVVPLIHFGHLVGAILLARPRIDRGLDWEDFDMLRAAGRQVASYISEAQGQQALGDAQRFEEFNRRFAFIMHDIKNLVSQLSLLARNAERHADNPAFRADMVLTLRESVGKMNELLARLSQHNRARQEEPRPVAVRRVAEKVARAKARQHPVDVVGDAPDALADPGRVEQILLHLVQNAAEATSGGAPVTMRIAAQGERIAVEVIDRGCGMTAEFIRRDLFKPFASTKAGGFGIGAFEARELARAMGGSITVESRPGEGSCFTLLLPRAVTDYEERAA